MSVVQNLCALALRQVVKAASQAIGLDGEEIVRRIESHFTDHSGRLTRALQRANERAWQAVEIALAGESLWERVQAGCARAEDKAFGRQVRAFLNAAPLPELAGKSNFRQTVLAELRAARKAGLLAGGALEPQQLARRAGAFARFTDPGSLLNVERQILTEMADEVRRAGYAKLAWFLKQRPAEGQPIHVAGIRYFFRREVEADAELFRGLAWAKLDGLEWAQEDLQNQMWQKFQKTWDELDEIGKAQNAAFASLDRHWDRVQNLLAGIQDIVVGTHGKVLDVQEQQRRHGGKLDNIDRKLERIEEKLDDLQQRPLRPAGGTLAEGLEVLRDVGRRLWPGRAAAPAQAEGKGASGLKPSGDPKNDPESTSTKGGKETPAWSAHEGRILSVAFAPDGKAILSAGADGFVRLWGLGGNELLRLQPPRSLFRRAAVVHATFTPDGHRVFSAAADGAIRLWNVNTGSEVRRFEVPGGVAAAAFSTDGRWLLAGGKQTVTLWDVADGRPFLRFGGTSGLRTGDVQCVAFTRQRNVLVGGLDGAGLYEGVRGEEQLRLKKQGGIFAVSALPAGAHALTGRGDHSVFVWDLEHSGGQVFMGHTGEVLAVAASRDGRLALSGGADQTVRLWLLKERTQVACLTGHAEQVRCVAFSPDGRQAVSGADDGTIRVWPIRA